MLHPTDHAIRYDLEARIARDDRNRWIVSGLAALTVTAAIVMMFAVARHDEVVTPAAIEPPVIEPSVIEPSATTPPATTPPATAPPPAFAPLGVIDGGGITLVALPAELAGDVRLHDAATIGDEPVLLVEQPPASCLGAPACEGTLWAFRPWTGTADLVATASVWEGGRSRLAFTAGGVVVGEYGTGPVVSPFTAVIPGATASPPDVGVVGLHESYVDCDCPSSFTIDGSGEFLAWLGPDPANRRAITIVRLSDGQTLVVPAGQGPAPFATIDASDVATDGTGEWSGTVLLNDRDTAAPQPPVHIDLAAPLAPIAGIEPGTASSGA